MKNGQRGHVMNIEKNTRMLAEAIITNHIMSRMLVTGITVAQAVEWAMSGRFVRAAGVKFLGENNWYGDVLATLNTPEGSLMTVYYPSRPTGEEVIATFLVDPDLQTTIAHIVLDEASGFDTFYPTEVPGAVVRTEVTG